MYEYLIKFKNYTDSDAEETCIRWSCCMPIPDNVKRDIEDYYKYKYPSCNTGTENTHKN